MKLNSVKNFVLSRTKVSNSSVQVGDLFITPNFDSKMSDEILKDVVEFAKKNFSDIQTLNGKSIRHLRYLFEDDTKMTQFFMGALTFSTIDNCKFSIVNSKIGNSATPLISVSDLKENEPAKEFEAVDEGDNVKTETETDADAETETDAETDAEKEVKTEGYDVKTETVAEEEVEADKKSISRKKNADTIGSKLN